MQGTRWRAILAGTSLVATVTLAGCGRSGTSSPAHADRPATEAIGCGDRRDGGRTVATAPPFAVTPIGVLVRPMVVPGAVADGACHDLQVTPGALGPDPTCLDVRSVVRDALHQHVSWWCRPADRDGDSGVDRDTNGHPQGMSDTPPTKPLPDIPDEPMPTPMPADPPTPQPGQPSG